MSDIGNVYAEGRERISGIVTALEPDQQLAPVPACPEWTVHDVVAHLSGVCADILAGNLEGVATDPWTATQVRNRKEWPTAEVVAEWSELAPQVEANAGAFPREAGEQWVADLTTHEHDIRGAVSQPGARDSSGVDIGLQFAVTLGLEFSLKAQHLPALRVVAGDREWTVGGDAAATTVSASPFDMLRAVTGRRSRNQILAFDWNGGDPEVHLRAFQFGPFTTPADDLDE
jgi:uncharacterized protein (TIGR03083 family)